MRARRLRHWLTAKPATPIAPSTSVKTSIPLHEALLTQPDFLNGDYSIKWLEEWLSERES